MVIRKNLFLEWQNIEQQRKEILHLVAVGERSVLQARRYIDLLENRLDNWRHKRDDFPSAPASLESVVGPAFPEITSSPIITSFRARSIFAVGLQLACYGAVLGFAMRLSLLAICYVSGVVFLCTLLDELPKAFHKQPVPVDQ